MGYQTQRFKKTSWSKLFTQGYDEDGEDGKDDNVEEDNDKGDMNNKDNLL